jgi:hypothetical protein
MNRELTKQEKNWLIRGLKAIENGENYLKQINDLRVIEKCDCGEINCHTVQFQHFEKGKSVGLVNDSTDDGRMLIILVHENNEMITELEII